MITQQIGSYWTAKQDFNGRTVITGGGTRHEAAHAMNKHMQEVVANERWAEGYNACKSALANGLSVWRREVCPYDEGTPQRQGWVKYVSEQAQELRALMGERA